MNAPSSQVKLYELFSDPDRWCNDAFAKDSNGDAVAWHSYSAVKWDLQGAIHRFTPSADICSVYTRIYGADEMSDGKSLPWVSKHWSLERVVDFLHKYNL